jgi:hypothetical protein
MSVLTVETGSGLRARGYDKYATIYCGTVILAATLHWLTELGDTS